MGTRTTRALDVLRRLSEARRIGQGLAAELLVEQLEELDHRGGYLRSMPADHPEHYRVRQHGQRAERPRKAIGAAE